MIFDHYPSESKLPPLLILHGLLGSKSNWKSLAKQYSKSFPVYCLDMRNHGDSPHSEHMTYDLMAEDLHLFVNKHLIGQRFSLLGHSMGGKVAMNFALRFASQTKLEKLIIEDIAPKNYPGNQGDVFQAIKEIDLGEIKSRKDAEEILNSKLNEPAIVQFILTNLQREKDSFYWRVNFPVLLDALEHICSFDSQVAFTNTDIESHFIYGTDSNYVSEEDFPTIKSFFPSATFHAILDANHWIHAHKPKDFSETLLKIIKKQKHD